MSEPFSITEAITAARWSKMAYDHGPMFRGSYPSTTFNFIDLMPQTDVQCLVVTEPSRVTFAFRGTADLRAWLVDAQIGLSPYRFRPGVKMHAGFKSNVEAILPRLAPIAQAAQKAGKDIYVTGHSLGGAEGCIFTYRLGIELAIKVKARYSFGEPRSLNRAGSRDYETLCVPTWRVLDEDDLVCRIPWRFGLYRHVGQTAFMDKWGNLAENEPWYAHLPSDLAAVCASYKSPLSDHGIDKYITRLTAYKASIQP